MSEQRTGSGAGLGFVMFVVVASAASRLCTSPPARPISPSLAETAASAGLPSSIFNPPFVISTAPVRAAETLSATSPMEAIELLRPVPRASLAGLSRAARVYLGTLALRRHDPEMGVRLLHAGDASPSSDSVMLFLLYGTVNPQLEQLRRDDPATAAALWRAAKEPIPEGRTLAVEGGDVVLRRVPD